MLYDAFESAFLIIAFALYCKPKPFYFPQTSPDLSKKQTNNRYSKNRKRKILVFNFHKRSVAAQ